MKQRFCLDTSVFINSWRKHYRPDVFPSYWNALDRLISRNAIFSCREVYEELMVQEDELADWAKRRKPVFEEPKEDTILELEALMTQYPNFAAQGGTMNAADPWVIAHARIAKAIVVTDENPVANLRPTKPPKIPNVCADLDLPCMGIVDFLHAVKVTL